jgi:uncharacterized protein YcsI (UPF0317 family)
VVTDSLARLHPREFRALCRRGRHQGPTAGVAVGYAQANLVILRNEVAAAFEKFCRLNPRPCPLLEVLAPGEQEPRRSAPGADVRNDLPRYRVFRRGQCADQPTSIESIWESDFVAFLIGCSFTFESALLRAGLPVRHVEQGRNVPMYRTNLACDPAGPFGGPLVVSMRPMTPDQARRAVQVTSPFTSSHGGPVRIGEPEALGILDIGRPDFGDAVTVHPGEVPVFWACGVTPMAAIMQADLDVAVTHEPGHMLVTDLPDDPSRSAPCVR